MSDIVPDSRTAASEPAAGNGPQPQVFAPLASLSGDAKTFQSGELPVWSRLDVKGRQASRGLQWLAALAWCAVLGLLVVAAARVFFHDATLLLTWLNAFTRYLYLPAYFALALALLTKRWWLATASAVLVACHLTWVLPELRPATPYVPPNTTTTEASPPLTIFFANVRGGENLKMDELLAEARSYDPDVIVLVEMQRYWWHRFFDKRPLTDYPYGTDLDHRNAGDVGVFSRLPVSRIQAITIEGRTSLALDLRLGDQMLRLFALHSPRPHPNTGADDYYRFWQQMEGILASERGPIVAVGDFNATQYSRVYDELRADGLRSAHEDRGRGYATTWPNGVHWIPPIRIDQALLSPDVECVSIREGAGTGSDHKSLILEVRVHGNPAPAAGG